MYTKKELMEKFEMTPEQANDILKSHATTANPLRESLAERDSQITELRDANQQLTNQVSSYNEIKSKYEQAQQQVSEYESQVNALESKVNNSSLEFAVFNEVIKSNPVDPETVFQLMNPTKYAEAEDVSAAVAEDLKSMQENKSFLFQGEPVVSQQSYNPQSSTGKVPKGEDKDPDFLSALTAEIEGQFGNQSNQSNVMGNVRG